MCKIKFEEYNILNFTIQKNIIIEINGTDKSILIDSYDEIYHIFKIFEKYINKLCSMNYKNNIGKKTQFNK